MNRLLTVALLVAMFACSKREAAPAAGSGSDTGSSDQRRVQPITPPRKVSPGTTSSAPADPAATPDPDGPREIEPTAGSGSGPHLMRPRIDEHGQRQSVSYFDTDHDGKISDQERTTMQVARSTALLNRLDGDKDGKVTQTELEKSRFAPFVTSFDKADADKNGYLDQVELRSAMEASARERAARRAAYKSGAGSGSGSSAP